MPEITKIKKGIIFECDCGATHKIILDENKEIKVKSTYKQKEDEDEAGKKRPPEKREEPKSKSRNEGNNDDNDDDEGIFF